MEAPGFSPAKQQTIDDGFSRGQPGLKPGSIVVGTAERACPERSRRVPFRRSDFKLTHYLAGRLRCVSVRACFIVDSLPDEPMTDHPHSASTFESKIKTGSPRFERNQKAVADLVSQVRQEEEIIRQG